MFDNQKIAESLPNVKRSGPNPLLSALILFNSQASVLCTDRIRFRAFLDRRIVGLLRLRLVSAHSETCLKGCHSKFSSGSTSLEAFLSRNVLKATKRIAKLKSTPTSITSQPGASPTVARVTKT